MKNSLAEKIEILIIDIPIALILIYALFVLFSNYDINSQNCPELIGTPESLIITAACKYNAKFLIVPVIILLILLVLSLFSNLQKSKKN